MASSPIYLRRLLVRRRCIVMHIFNMGQNHGIDHFFLLVIVSTPSLQKSTFFSFCKISFGISQTYTVNVRGIHLIFSLLWGNEVANDSTVFEIRTNQTPPPFPQLATSQEGQVLCHFLIVSPEANMSESRHLCNGLSGPGFWTHPRSWLDLCAPGACIQGWKIWTVQEEAFLLILHGTRVLMWPEGSGPLPGLWLLFLDLSVPEHRCAPLSCHEGQAGGGSTSLLVTLRGPGM